MLTDAIRAELCKNQCPSGSPPPPKFEFPAAEAKIIATAAGARNPAVAATLRRIEDRIRSAAAAGTDFLLDPFDLNPDPECPEAVRIAVIRALIAAGYHVQAGYFSDQHPDTLAVCW